MSEALALGSERAGPLDLRRVLTLDAATCVVMGLLLVTAASPLSASLGLPRGLVFWAGAALFPCALLMAGAALTRSAPLVWLVILGNGAWVVASVAVTLLLDPSWIGIVFVIGQAAVVSFLLVLERHGQAASSVSRAESAEGRLIA